MLLIPKTNVAFIHIPKTAGQSVRDAFGIDLNGRSSHSLDTAEDKALIRGHYIRFCVVRNPLTRFVSAYTYNVHHTEAKPTGVRKVILENGLNKDINDFVAFFYGNKKHRFSDFDHFKRQVFYCRTAKPQIILRQENLAKDIQIIARLVPEHFVGLGQRNSAKDRQDDPDLVTELTPKSQEMLLDYYDPDFLAFGYPRPKE